MIPTLKINNEMLDKGLRKAMISFRDLENKCEG